MICETCTCSPESAVDYSQTSFSGMSQLSLLSGMPTPVESCDNEPQTDGSQACTCGKEMSDCSIHPSTPEKWIAFMQDSLAKTLALLESMQAYLREPDQVFTEKSCVLLASFDQSSCSWKTLQQSFLTDSEPFSQTWPRWGMTAGGYAYAHPMSELFICEIGGFYLPTLTARDYKSDSCSMEFREKRDAMTMGKTLPWVLGGLLNPAWCEWYMGFPVGFTELKDSETHKSHCKPQSPTDYLVGSEAA